MGCGWPQVTITCGQEGKFSFLDHNPLKRSTRLLEADLHNPACVKVVKKEIPMRNLYAI